MNSKLFIWLLLGIFAVGFWATPRFEVSSDDGPLEEYMETLGKHVKKLRSQIENPDLKEDNLKRICEMQKAALGAKTEVPHTIEELADEKAKNAALTDYRIYMIQLTQELLVMETHLIQNDFKAANSSLYKLFKIKKKGHKRFKDDD